ISSAVLLLVLTSGAGLRAQPSRTDPVDVQSRFGTQLNVNLPKKWEFTAAYEARMTGNSSTYRGSYFSGELGRPFGKHLSVLANYRFARLTDSASHRFGAGAEVEAKRHRLTLPFRTLVQYQPKALDDEQGSHG